MNMQSQSEKQRPQPSGEDDAIPQTKPDRSPRAEDDVDETSEESFPASDPPSWTGSTASRDVPRDQEGH